MFELRRSLPFVVALGLVCYTTGYSLPLPASQVPPSCNVAGSCASNYSELLDNESWSFALSIEYEDDDIEQVAKIPQPAQVETSEKSRNVGLLRVQKVSAPAGAPQVETKKKVSTRAYAKLKFDAAKSPAVKNSELYTAVERTRRKIQMRDEDIIVVSYPKSGTHWLASVVSHLAFANSTLEEPTFEVRAPAKYFFHNLPVFWLIPEAVKSGELSKVAYEAKDIPDEVFDSINSVPQGQTRIFLSHMPEHLFEYAPTPKTKIVYLIREPHAVWYSMAKWISRVLDSVRGKVGATFDELPVIDMERFTAELLRGDVHLPPRMQETGPEFTWRRHIGGWWDRIKKAALPGQKRSSFVVDFDTAMQDTEHAIKQIAYALDLPGWGHDDAQDDWQAKVVDKHTQYGEVKESISSFYDNEVDDHTLTHFPEKSYSRSERSWAPHFLKMPAGLQGAFNTHNAQYGSIARAALHRQTGLVVP